MANVSKYDLPGEVGFKETKQGRCIICRKSCGITRKFAQVMDKNNVDKNGVVKDRMTIMREEREKANEWLKIPIKHLRCEEEERNGKKENI